MTNKLQELDAMIDGFDTAMLVTRSLEGELRARPMAISDHRSGGSIRFVTRAEDEKLQELLHEGHVAVTMQGDDRFLSISGKAQLEAEPALAAELWTPTMRLWFPGGRSDAQFSVVTVEPSYAEYWDRSGARGIEFLWEAGRALVAGRKADDAGLSGHAKIPMPQEPEDPG
jgi:general stress protein 26